MAFCNGKVTKLWHAGQFFKAWLSNLGLGQTLCLCLLFLSPVHSIAAPLNPHWLVHWDTKGQLQVADVYIQKLNWQPDSRHGVFGYRAGVLWAQFTVPAMPDGQPGQLLSVGLPYLDQIDVYPWGQLQPLAALGDTRPVPQPLISSTTHVVRLPALPSPQRYLVRVQSTSAMNVRAQLLSDQDLLQAGSSGQFKAGVFVTLYLLSAIMYLVGAVVMRQPVQLAYSFYLVCLLAIFVGVSQPILLNDWLGTPKLANWVTGFGILLVPAAACLLWIVILRLRSTYPLLYKIYLALALGSVLSLATVNTPLYQQAAQLSVLGILLFGVFNLGLALWCMRQPGQRLSIGLFVAAFFLSTVTAIVNNLSVVGAISAQPWFAAAFDASSLVHVMLLAIATNLSIRELETKARESLFQQKLLTTQRDQIQSFSAFVAHELLGPMARIGRSAEMLLRDTTLAARAAKRASDIRLWAFETGKLVEAFLNSASLKSGRALVKPVPVVLSDWLAGLQTELTLNYAHATLSWHLADATHSATFDPLLAKVALENIVINALKYAGTSDVVAIAVEAQNDRVEITVDDLGPGLKPGQYELVGEEALLREPTQEKPGFGLGLALVATIARAHGGNFSASPRQPRGVHWVLSLGPQQAVHPVAPSA